MKDYHITIFWSDEDGGYIADIPDLEALADEALAEHRAGRTLPLDPDKL